MGLNGRATLLSRQNLGISGKFETPPDPGVRKPDLVAMTLLFPVITNLKE